MSSITNDLSSNVNIVSNSQTGQSAAVKQAADGGTEATAQSNDSTAVSPAYSVEISEQGMHASRAAGAGSPPPGGPAGGAPTKAAATASSASSAIASVTDSSQSSLSSCSESQLKEMLSEKKITQSEYNAEIAKREEAKEAQSTSTSGSESASSEAGSSDSTKTDSTTSIADKAKAISEASKNNQLNTLLAINTVE